MRRFWADRSLFQGKKVLLKGELFRHITKVCRIRKGEVFELLAGGAQKHRVRLTAQGRFSGEALVEETFALPPPPEPHIHLFLSMPRWKTADAVLEKAAELDVKAFHPFVSEFSFFNKKAGDGKFKRWQSIAQAAAAQSLRAEPLEIHPLKRFQDISFFEDKNALALMAYEGSGAPLLDAESLLKKLKKPPSQTALFIGSEGGFSPAEADFFQKKGGRLFSLGERILRVETACIAALSLLKYAFHFSKRSKRPCQKKG